MDTGADVNALSQKTFRNLFPNVDLQPLNVILENFDKSCVRPVITFKCFLRWKGRKYRINMEVMSQDHTSNVLPEEITPLMESSNLLCGQKVHFPQNETKASAET